MTGITRLHSRIEKLELKINPAQETESTLINISFVSPGEIDRPRDEVKRIQGATRDWHREAGESVDAFISRTLEDAQRDRGNGPVICLGFPE